MEIEKRLKDAFQLDYNITENDTRYDLKASYREVCGRIFITPQDIIDRMEFYETIYIRTLRQPGKKDIEAFFQSLCRIGNDLVPGKDHFQTDLTGILIADRLPAGISAALKKMRYQRTYRFYFRGWCQVKFLLVELSTDKIFCNPAAKGLKKNFAPKKYNLELEEE